MAPRERDSKTHFPSSRGLEPRRPGGAHRAQQPGVLFSSRGRSARLRGPGGRNYRQARWGARRRVPTDAGAARCPDPHARGSSVTLTRGGALPTPLHPAAGGQCRYEEKASIVLPAATTRQTWVIVRLL